INGWEFPSYTPDRLPILAVAASGSQLVIATKGTTKTVSVTSLTDSGRLPMVIPLQKQPTGIALSADGRWGGANVGGAVRAWKLPSGEETRLLGPGGRYGRPSFSPDGRYLGVGGLVVEVSTGTVRTGWNPAGYDYDFAFQPRGSLVASGTRGVRVWDPIT